MRRAFILVQISPPEAPSAAAEASGGDILAKMKALPALCRPAGWIALWRRIAGFSVLSRQAQA
jgi:hypothetical protein